MLVRVLETRGGGDTSNATFHEWRRTIVLYAHTSLTGRASWWLISSVCVHYFCYTTTAAFLLIIWRFVDCLLGLLSTILHLLNATDITSISLHLVNDDASPRSYCFPPYTSPLSLSRSFFIHSSLRLDRQTPSCPQAYLWFLFFAY